MAGDRARMKQIEQEADTITDQSLDATRRMVRLAADTQQVGAKTLQTLDEQGEQLRRIDQGLDATNSELRKAERELTQMEKCCGCCLCKCCPSNFERSGKYARRDFKSKRSDGADAKVISKQPKGKAAASDDDDDDDLSKPMTSLRGASNPKSAAGGSQFIKRVTNDAREDEMNANLGTVHTILGDLKQQALAIDAELDEQNVVLDRLGRKVESNTARVGAASDRTGALIKSG